jgi:hypothetical protein
MRRQQVPHIHFQFGVVRGSGHQREAGGLRQMSKGHDDRKHWFEDIALSNTHIEPQIVAACRLDPPDSGYEVFGTAHFQHGWRVGGLRRTQFRISRYNHILHELIPASQHNVGYLTHTLVYRNCRTQGTRGCAAAHKTDPQNIRAVAFTASILEYAPRSSLRLAHPAQSLTSALRHASRARRAIYRSARCCDFSSTLTVSPRVTRLRAALLCSSLPDSRGKTGRTSHWLRLLVRPLSAAGGSCGEVQ